MDSRAVNQKSGPTGKFSILDWPTPDMLQAANRARAKAARDMVVALGKWAIAFVAGHPISNSPRIAADSDRLPVVPKRRETAFVSHSKAPPATRQLFIGQANRLNRKDIKC
jgi:hypothetical protein